MQLLPDSGYASVNPLASTDWLTLQVAVLSVEAGDSRDLPNAESLQGHTLLHTDQNG